MRKFLEMCRENGWAAAFYQTLPDFVPTYHSLRLKKLTESIVKSLNGKRENGEWGDEAARH